MSERRFLTFVDSADLERCHALYGVPVNERIQWWIRYNMRKLEDCDYERCTQELDAIQ